MNQVLLRKVDEGMLRLAETIYEGKVKRVVNLTASLKAECRRRGGLEMLADLEMVEKMALDGLVMELENRYQKHI